MGALRRRRDASLRLEPLACGCRDPWLHDHRDVQPVQAPSEHQLDGWRDTAAALLNNGLTPMLPTDVLRALWWRGGADRALAEQLHAAGGQAA